MAPPLSPETKRRLELLFPPEEQARVAAIIEDECGNNLPFLERYDSFQMERFRFAALKLSEGDLAKLNRAVEVAKVDWRDLLVAAGFGHDVRIHETWVPEKTWT